MTDVLEVIMEPLKTGITMEDDNRIKGLELREKPANVLTAANCEAVLRNSGRRPWQPLFAAIDKLNQFKVEGKSIDINAPLQHGNDEVFFYFSKKYDEEFCKAWREAELYVAYGWEYSIDPLIREYYRRGKVIPAKLSLGEIAKIFCRIHRDYAWGYHSHEEHLCNGHLYALLRAAEYQFYSNQFNEPYYSKKS